jgi:hypothetical protein
MDQKGGGGDHGDVPKIPIRPPLTVAKAVVLFGEGLQRPLKGDSGGEANTMLEAGAADLDWIAQVGCGGTLRPRSGHEGIFASRSLISLERILNKIVKPLRPNTGFGIII